MMYVILELAADNQLAGSLLVLRGMKTDIFSKEIPFVD
jgi:hypothetical protein